MAETKAVHGSYTRYTTGGCRCELCHAAMLRYNKRRLTLIERGEWRPWADAQPVRDHVARLRAAGLSIESIGELAGVAYGNIQLLLSSDRTRVRANFAAKLLAVRVDLGELPPWARVDATGTRRRLQALIVLGWSATCLAERMGLERQSIRKVMSRPRVRVSTASAVREIYAELSIRTPPNTTRYERAMVTRTRRYAASQGWVSAMAWDDIDDPKEKPKGARRDLAELGEAS
ncbi:hypothetical protein ABT294_00770 [Nonomuraea sp. NPDC000554]|uniref:hypothetical protein n=1 Tax=Nonomuraea sp. NPDC000554 TaxID=3154259 RepID=UPI003318D42A